MKSQKLLERFLILVALVTGFCQGLFKQTEGRIAANKLFSTDVTVKQLIQYQFRAISSPFSLEPGGLLSLEADIQFTLSSSSSASKRTGNLESTSASSTEKPPFWSEANIGQDLSFYLIVYRTDAENPDFLFLSNDQNGILEPTVAFGIPAVARYEMVLSKRNSTQPTHLSISNLQLLQTYSQPAPTTTQLPAGDKQAVTYQIYLLCPYSPSIETPAIKYSISYVYKTVQGRYLSIEDSNYMRAIPFALGGYTLAICVYLYMRYFKYRQLLQLRRGNGLHLSSLPTLVLVFQVHMVVAFVMQLIYYVKADQTGVQQDIYMQLGEIAYGMGEGWLFLYLGMSTLGWSITDQSVDLRDEMSAIGFAITYSFLGISAQISLIVGSSTSFSLFLILFQTFARLMFGFVAIIIVNTTKMRYSVQVSRNYGDNLTRGRCLHLFSCFRRLQHLNLISNVTPVIAMAPVFAIILIGPSSSNGAANTQLTYYFAIQFVLLVISVALQYDMMPRAYNISTAKQSHTQNYSWLKALGRRIIPASPSQIYMVEQQNLQGKPSSSLSKQSADHKNKHEVWYVPLLFRRGEWIPYDDLPGILEFFTGTAATSPAAPAQQQVMIELEPTPRHQ